LSGDNVGRIALANRDIGMPGNDLSIDEVAQYLKLPKETLYKYVRAGQIPAKKVGREWHLDRRKIDAWVEAHANARHGYPRILVVDDDSSVRGVFLKWFKVMGYPAAGAPGGREALAMLKKGRFDLVFLDLKMPDLNGVETLRSIRRMKRSPDVVIVTGFYESSMMEQVLEMGPVKVLRKPVSKSALLQIVKSCERRVK
jgi:excisionase family DNA binding protein